MGACTLGRSAPLLLTVAAPLHVATPQVIHGLYVMRTEPIRVDEALQLCAAHERDPRFPVRMEPSPLPVRLAAARLPLAGRSRQPLYGHGG